MISAISPIDGRYINITTDLESYFSEFALIKYRIIVEIEFLKKLASEPEITELKSFTNNELEELQKILKDFNLEEAEKVKKIEETTKHDVKAVEYYLRDKLNGKIDPKALEFIHFSCTSEDINNLAYALMIKNSIEDIILPKLHEIHSDIFSYAQLWKNVSMLSRTHGQTATPTTLGKEFWVFSERLSRQLQHLESQDYLGKLNGATGNISAHAIAYPDFDWLQFSKSFIESLGLTPNIATTQIESHDFLAEIFDTFSRVNTILIDFSRDIWGYISIGYFGQKVNENEVGSSTMPHKVNPIDFENAEGNFGISIALNNFFSSKLPISRFQRDLSDSTVMRNIGTSFSYSLIGYVSLI